MEPLLVGAKQGKLATYRAGKIRRTATRSFERHGAFATATITSIEQAPRAAVYSIEVEDTHTFVTTYGNDCIPIYPFYLTWKAREVGKTTRFIDLSGKVNHSMPDYVVQRTALALNDRGKSVKGSRVLVLGLAYKPDVDDVRSAPASS